MVFECHLPTRVIFGVRSLELLNKAIGELDYGSKILLVTGRRSMKKLGVTDRVTEILSEREVEVFDKVESNPSVGTVEQGVESCRKNKSSVVVGLGGGSVLDAGKAIAAFVKNKPPVGEVLDGKASLTKEGLPFIAIPTTSGSSSEVTLYSVLTKGGKKRTIMNKLLYPQIALLDPELTLTLGKKNTAIPGLDVLSHSMESYWSTHSNPLADVHALESIKQVNTYLEKTCSNLQEIECREKMMLASLHAGLAITQTRTTLVHSISYPMTTIYGVPHGLACGLTLPQFLEYNYRLTEGDCNDPRGVDFVRRRLEEMARALGEETVEKAADRVTELMRNIGLPTTLSKAGVESIEEIVSSGMNPGKLETNPRKVTEKDLRVILAAVR